MKSNLLIGKIAKQFGLSNQAIRYYEKIGLIESPPRSAKGYRLYSSATVKRLQLIKYAQKFGLSLDQIKEIILVDDLESSIVSLNNAVKNHLKDLERQLKQIEIAYQETERRHQQLNQIILENNYERDNTVDRCLLNLFTKIEASLSVENQKINKATKLLELYGTGERNFQGIELIGAELNGAFLCQADFSHAEMMLASLNEASLERTKLNHAFLSGTDLIDAYLYRAEFIKANLIGADLTHADLTEANLTGCNLGGANLSNANLQGANLTEAVLIGANLQGANLQGAITSGCNLLEANLENTILSSELGI